MEILYWSLVAIVAWCYVGYPLFVGAQARLRPRPVRPALTASGDPSVAVVIAVRNEQSTIVQRIDNLLAQDYPADRLEIVVVCNGTTDDTEALAERYGVSGARVRVLRSPGSEGKSGALNRGIASTDADCIVFADARQTFALNAVRRLVSPFADPRVGAVTGRLVVKRADRPAVEGVRWYWGLETWLRAAESRSGSVMGATGAIYAIRRTVFEPFPPNLILDDVYNPLRIALGGDRIVMATDALAYDVPAGGQGAEYARKRRTMVGNIQLPILLPRLLAPWNPIFLRYFSHKLLRLLTPFCLVGMLVVSATLAGAFYQTLFAAQLGLYLLGILGLMVRAPSLSFPAAFVLIHAAIFAAFYHWRSDASHVWVAPTVPQTIRPEA
jgi:biofilm PGA synthesis N-glycosyltransferase PgaC